MILIFSFDSDLDENVPQHQDMIESAMKEFHHRIVEKVALRAGQTYWLMSSPGVRVGTVKVTNQGRENWVSKN